MFDYDVSWRGFLWVYSVQDLLSFVNLKVHAYGQIREMFSHSFSKSFFQPHLCLLSLWDSNSVSVRTLVIVSQALDFVHFFFLRNLSFLYLRLVL